MSISHSPTAEVEFPDSDGKPMAENTRQYEAIVTLKGNIEAFAPATAFVAGDHLIYVDPTDPTERQAPDVYVAFGRPRGHRGSYMVWEEEGVFPQVIFEVLAPSNTETEMRAKREFYFGHGAEEYYEFDPEAGTWLGFVLNATTGLPEPLANMDGYVSPRLQMRFAFSPMELLVFRPDGSRFLSFQEINDLAETRLRRADEAEQRADAEEQRADEEKRRADEARQLANEAQQRAEAENQRANEAQQRAEAEQQRADVAQAERDRLRELLRTLGIDPDKPAQP